MDFWASMEHRVSYKKNRDDRERLTEELRNYADMLVKIEKRFEVYNENGKISAEGAAESE